MSGMVNIGNTCYCNVVLQLLVLFDILDSHLKQHEINHVDGRFPIFQFKPLKLIPVHMSVSLVKQL